MDIFISIFITSGTSIGIIILLIKLFGQGILDRLNQKWKAQYDKELEDLKHKYLIDNNKFSNILEIFSSNNKLIQDKRIEAISKIWNIVDEISKQCYITDAIYDLIDAESFEIITTYSTQNLTKNKIIEKIMNQNTDQNQTIATMFKFKSDIKKYRPYITNDTWTFSKTYIDFIGNCKINLIESYQKDKKIADWRTNESIKNILKLSISENDLTQIYSYEKSSYQIIKTYLEEILLLEFKAILSGESSIKERDELINNISKNINSNKSNLERMLNNPEIKPLIKSD